MFGLDGAVGALLRLELIDSGWRVKTGFVLFLALGAALCIYPTYHDERHGRIDDRPVSAEQRASRAPRRSTATCGVVAASCSPNIPFRLVRGLDLKGGLRLVYTVDVDEAIKDKRDRYYDEMRARARHGARLPHGRQAADASRSSTKLADEGRASRSAASSAGRSR